jgi:hypothetical protein
MYDYRPVDQWLIICTWFSCRLGAALKNSPVSGHFIPIDIGFLEPYPQPEIADAPELWRKVAAP